MHICNVNDVPMWVIGATNASRQLLVGLLSLMFLPCVRSVINSRKALWNLISFCCDGGAIVLSWTLVRLICIGIADLGQNLALVYSNHNDNTFIHLSSKRFSLSGNAFTDS